MHLLLGFWWPLMVSYPPAGMSTAVCWAEGAQGPPGAGLVPPVPMRGLALALSGPESGRCKAHTGHVIGRKTRLYLPLSCACKRACLLF